jgi:hypothetical protein
LTAEAHAPDVPFTPHRECTVLIHRLASAAAGAVTIALVAASIAGARPLDEPGGQPRSGSVQERNLSALSMRATSAKSTPQVQPTVVRVVDDGFDWGSAAIGAGGATGILLLATTGAAAATHRHRRVSALP